MAQAREIVTLRARGKEFANWTGLTLSRSLDSFPSAFSVSMSAGQPGTINPLGIATGDPVEVYLGRELLLTGYAEEVTESRGKSGRLRSVSGRSRAVDAMCSCTGEPPEFLGGYLDSIATALAAPYGLSVASEVVTLEPLARWAPEPGETVIGALERLCHAAGAFVTDDAAGNLILAVKGMTAAAALDAAACTEIEVKCSSADRYSEYRVYGQRRGDDAVFAADAATPVAIVQDSAIERYRMLVVMADQQADIAACGRRGVWEAVTRAGRSAVVTLTVPGWRDGDGALYAPNVLRRVEDSDLGVWAELLVTDVTLRLDSGGTLTEMTLMPPGAFELQPPEERKKPVTSGFRSWWNRATTALDKAVPGKGAKAAAPHEDWFD